MTRWAMVIDLRKCIGCETCKHVCNEMHETPHVGVRRRIISPKANSKSDSKRLFIPIHCMHCERPSCLSVCPTGATKRLSDGTVVVESDQCMGCGSCILACPYGARTLLDQRVDFVLTETIKKSNTPCTDDRIGTCTKCDFCHSIIEKALSEEMRPGIDTDATPLCVRYCIAEALYFGDLDDPSSEVSQLVHQNDTFRVGESPGTQPSVYYIMDDRCE
jgi:phenylacetyl-CoA:acceptor oxidoreductase subunit 1